MKYSAEVISIEKKHDLADLFGSRILYEVKSDIYGCCIKLLTDKLSVKNRWEESFYFASHNIRSHGRLYVIEDLSEKENKVYYDPLSKTAFLFNMDYYGWIKSIALSLAGDLLEDEHSIYSVHGACLDIGGRGICLLGDSGVGKTTHTYGLLKNPKVRVVSDDWFYGRIFGDDILAFGSEKNFYIRADLAQIWREFQGLVQHAESDGKGRAVVDLRWVIGKGRILPLTTLQSVIMLKRDLQDKKSMIELETTQALQRLEESSYYNPHLLVKSQFKKGLRSRFFQALLERTAIYEVNTIGTPEESLKIIKEISGLG